ncbi:putative threonine efflux protein [Desulfocapsa sulfexigens DSM 10523]|uniref:Putative threonine efflux protein n=1 Tax=Desulfocapsa sulfexigens (strain DSM 10523 / SB164P1) TaxID=1167006 RepID=M1NZH4_DESSD|nr:LysE family translocator [Desulfocapsa sulfexigens]AGF76668.1 putative threonine efflux protein [Desulfocapsa sulfexigens DSM 10523]
MTFAAWFSLATICILGAMSPGPSLAVVLKNTLAGGRAEGVKTALAHGFGVGLYAFATVAGLAVLIIGSPLAFTVIQWLGALFLAYLGIRAIAGSTGLSDAAQTDTGACYRGNGLRSGFLTAFLNPKLAIFFAALFSQFVSAQALLPEKIIMALTAAFIDAGWYLLVVLVLSHSKVLSVLRSRAALLEKVFGILLLLLAFRMVFSGSI